MSGTLRFTGFSFTVNAKIALYVCVWNEGDFRGQQMSVNTSCLQALTFHCNGLKGPHV